MTDRPLAAEIALHSFDRILVPLDGSKLSEGAFHLVRWFVERQQADVKLLTVLSSQEDWTDNPVEETCDYLDWRRRALAEFGSRVRYAIRVGDPADEILAESDSSEPDLIVMATHARRGLDRWRHGSVTERVIRGARVPVLAANPTGLEESDKPRLLRLGRILVPLDGSARATEILPPVAELARLYHSVVTLLHVQAPIVVPSMIPVEVGSARDTGRPILEPWREALAAAGAHAVTRTIVGSAPAEILRIANEESYDLVALTTHGRSGFARFMLGSIAEHTLRQCRCPVLLKRTVPAPSPVSIEPAELSDN
ncbi:MAG TPA: universal stress protein [Planctomycetota bacterium]|nr:universal stress protein [Planctomycetota bacterium]